MEHLETIRAYIKTLVNNEDFHALVVQSPPGWGKSTAITQALSELGISAVNGGSYATPLHIYNTMCRHPGSMIVLDDCAGLFGDVKSMAILKAATWNVSRADGKVDGASITQKSRQVAWGSTSEKVEQPCVDFSGKLILLTNTVPAGKETEAFLSRCLSYCIQIGREDVERMLLAAAESEAYFPEVEIAREVARFLVENSASFDISKVSLRTLKLGYNLARTHHDGNWRDLFTKLLPRIEEPGDGVSKIIQPGVSAREQELKFLAVTGKSRRTFYNYKKKLGLTRSYRGKK